MTPRPTILILLTAIALQGMFGGLRDSVVICLGGGHVHESTEVVEQCETECSGHSHHDHHAHHTHHTHHTHRNEGPAPTPTDGDQGGGCCTDIELPLVVLLTNQRTSENDIADFPPLPTIMTLTQAAQENFSLREHEAIFKEDPGGLHRLALIKSTRLII